MKDKMKNREKPNDQPRSVVNLIGNGSMMVNYDSRVVIWVFQVRYDSTAVNNDRRALIRLTSG